MLKRRREDTFWGAKSESRVSAPFFANRNYSSDSLQKRFSFCSSHKINANIVVFCWLTGLQWNNYITSVFHWNVTIWLVMKWSHDYKMIILYPELSFLLRYTTSLSTLILQNLVKWALTEMECSVAGTTTLDREWLYLCCLQNTYQGPGGSMS